jgi:ATP-dependent DNA helicase RecQ
MLCGSRSAKMSKFKLDQLSTFGLLSVLTQQEAGGLLDELIRTGLVEQVDVDRFRPVLALSEAGEQVMRGEAALPEQLRVDPVAAAKLRGMAAATETSGAAAEPEIELGPDDLPLLEALRDWRRDEAERRQCAPFLILHNKTLERIAQLRPQTLAELEAVKGMGPAVVQRHGDSIVSLVTGEPTAPPEVDEFDRAASPPPEEQADPDAEPEAIWEEPLIFDEPPPPERPAEHVLTWRVARAGFNLDECAAVRRLPLQQVIEHLMQSSSEGRTLDLHTLLTQPHWKAAERDTDSLLARLIQACRS